MSEASSPKQAARESAAQYENRPEMLLEILHDLQARIGHVPDDAAAELAEALNLSRADVHGVVSFYHDFRTKAGGRNTLKICRAEACQSLGCEELLAYAEQRTATACGATSSNGLVSLETVYCLGNCALAPAAMLNDRLVGRLSREKLDTLLERTQEYPA